MASVIAIKSFNFGDKRIVRGSTFYPEDAMAHSLVNERKVRIISLEDAKKKENEPVICSGLNASVSQAGQASQSKTASKSKSGETLKKQDESL